MNRRQLERGLARLTEAAQASGPDLQRLANALRFRTTTSSDLDSLFLELHEHLEAWVLVCALKRRAERREGDVAPHRMATPMCLVVEIVSYAADEPPEEEVIKILTMTCFDDEAKTLEWARKERWEYVLLQVTRGGLLRRLVQEPTAMELRETLDLWERNLDDVVEPFPQAPLELLEALEPILTVLPDYDLIWDHRAPARWTQVDKGGQEGEIRSETER